MKKNRIIFLIFLIFYFFNCFQASALSLSVHVAEKYATTYPGERVYFEVEINYPENPKRKDVKLFYEVLDKNGKSVARSQVLTAIEIQSSLIDFIAIPKSIDSGIYTINVEVRDYEFLAEESYASFEVGPKFEKEEWYFLILALMILIVMILVAIDVVRKKG